MRERKYGLNVSSDDTLNITTIIAIKVTNMMSTLALFMAVS
jgi:hypothetical protein